MIHCLIIHMIINLIIHMIHRLIIQIIIQMIIHRQLTDAEKLRKVVVELVDTERTYVKHLSYLMQVDNHHRLEDNHHFPHHYLCHQDKDLNPNFKTYLEPLKGETFLSNTEINALFGNIQEIYGFQQQVRIMKIMNMMLMMLLWVMLCLEISTKSITSRKR